MCSRHGIISDILGRARTSSRQNLGGPAKDSLTEKPSPASHARISLIPKRQASRAALTTSNKAADTAIPVRSEAMADDIQALMTDYGRSIIKSAIDHEPEEAETLKTNIIAAKEKIIVKYKTVENELKIAEGEVRTSRKMASHWQGLYAGSLQTRKDDSARIQDLEKQLKDQSEENKRSAELLAKEIEKCKALEVESAKTRRDKKRKRESVAAIWEDAEKVKLN